MRSISTFKLAFKRGGMLHKIDEIVRKNHFISVGIIVIWGAIAISAVYLNQKRFIIPASASTGVNVITNFATLSYEDSQEQDREVTSNTVQTMVKSLIEFRSDFFSRKGWYLMSFPSKTASMEPRTLFKYGEGGFNIDGRIYTWDPYISGQRIWSEWEDPCNPDQDHIKDNICIQRGEGFWFDLEDDADVNKLLAYEGEYDETTPVNVDLSRQSNSTGNGWATIGNPFSHDIDIASKMFIKNDINGDGKIDDLADDNIADERKSFCEAANIPAPRDPWVDPVMWGWDSSTQGLFDAGCSLNWASNVVLQAYHGYWIQTVNNNNLKLEMLP